jgi:hypothetical protein
MNYAKEPYETTMDVSVGYQEEKGASVLVVPDETRPLLQPYWGDYKLCIASWTENREKAEDFLVRLMTDADSKQHSVWKRREGLYIRWRYRADETTGKYHAVLLWIRVHESDDYAFYDSDGSR